MSRRIRIAVWAACMLATHASIAAPSAAPPPHGPVLDFYDSGIVEYSAVFHPVIAREAMVASQNDLASRIGLEVLERGGNAVDAAVAVGFALAVVLPRAGNLGGGGFMLLHMPEDKLTTSFDYRESAPTNVAPKDFLGPDGKITEAAKVSWQSAAVPGTVAGLHLAWSRYGSRPWAELVQPAIRLAERGYAISYDFAGLLELKKSWLQEDDAVKRAYYRADGTSYRAGEILRQPDLARTLRRIARSGPQDFYKGETARRIVADMQHFGGGITAEDLASYRAIERQPISGEYRGYRIVGMAPPSSGGIGVIQTLNVLGQFPVADWGASSARALHVFAEASRHVSADRGRFLADPDFVSVPTERLISQQHAQEIAARISPTKAGSAAEIRSFVGSGLDSPSTTHYSIVDKHRNVVSNTYTLGFSFGNGHMIRGTGVLLNNSTTTFSMNATGRPPRPNDLQAGKRALSTQAPTLVFKDEKPYLVTGSPGGARIISAVAQVVDNVLTHQMNIAEASAERRVHADLDRDVLMLEPGFNRDTAAALQALGHRIEWAYAFGSTQSIMIQGDYLYGASDPRRPDALSVGE
ncbi:gamma-glutamyltransferase [Steroidobacter agaridevorans]|uniref:gamma-glutamyltransferase n=1 Tax=Steroidobacter agaridevorans TaxID=2695856 RepID=UPI001326B5B8|nr:gamma-glutamyltransferase [Steroidobacter agaridevorans]GFE86866.1 gamma-glutamyltransferase [Steroidobacter agaridevorans]